MKRIAGVPPLWDGEKENIWMRACYMDGVLQAGGIPVILPFTEDEEEIDRLVELCDGFLFTGGPDISPALYHEAPRKELGEVCEKRDTLERLVLERALKAEKPVLGICRGSQLINAVLGGTLYQDLPAQHPSDTEHNQPEPYDVPVHEVTVLADTPLHPWLNTDRLEVNSMHHQAVRELAPCLEPMALSPDGLVEAAFRRDGSWLWTVQWHPERMLRTDPYSRMIFESFVKAME